MEKPAFLYDLVVRHASHKISRMYNEKAAEIGITMSFGFALLNIGKEGIPSTQLGPKMGMEATSLSRKLKIMEEQDLIRRVEDAVDKRKVFIYLSEKGIEKRKLFRDIVVGFNEHIFKSIPKTKLKTFYTVVEKVDQLIEEETQKHVKPTKKRRKA
jgi:DNA-binding MarR family transcriptional regulator